MTQFTFKIIKNSLDSSQIIIRSIEYPVVTLIMGKQSFDLGELQEERIIGAVYRSSESIR